MLEQGKSCLSCEVAFTSEFPQADSGQETIKSFCLCLAVTLHWLVL